MQRTFLEPGSKAELHQSLKQPSQALLPLNFKVNGLISRLLASNEVFLLHPVIDTGAKLRTQLPAFRDPNSKMGVWAILKENMGKELT